MRRMNEDFRVVRPSFDEKETLPPDDVVEIFLGLFHLLIYVVADCGGHLELFGRQLYFHNGTLKHFGAALSICGREPRFYTGVFV